MKLFYLAALPFVVAELREYWFNITYVENVNPTGQFSRRAIGVNGTWPPPILDVNQDDQVRVHAINGLDKIASIHHHGMLFPNTSYNDGAVGVTQCGIPVGETFTYDFSVAAQPPGTYWWHSHSLGEYVDGLRAPFVIHANQEPAQYDEEFTIMLGDWYEQEHPVLLKKFLSIANPGGAEPVPETALIYFAQNGTYLPGFNDNAKLPFQPGRRYRLRVINSSAFAMFAFWVDGHSMQVIEADGVDTQPYAADYISLGVAQRYSVIVEARNTTDSNFYFHANFNPDMFDGIPDGLRLNYTAQVVYNESAPFAAEGMLPFNEVWDDLGLQPVVSVPLTEPDVVYNLSIAFDTYDDGTNRGTFNTLVYNSPKTPTLLTQLTMGQNASVESVYGPEGYGRVLDYDKTIEVILWNTDAGMHPFHLHGHKFQLVSRSYDYTDDSRTFYSDPENPSIRDTVQVPGGGFTVFRFRSNNPGTWMMHCHIEWHLESGLAMIFVEAPTLAQQWISLPSQVADQCAAQGLPTSGNAAGLNSLTDLKGLQQGPYPQILGWRPKGIVALTGCIVTALLGILAIVWYTFGGPDITEEEHYEEVKAAIEAKDQKRVERKAFFSRLIPGHSTAN